jgi:acetyl esterase/lipase
MNIERNIAYALDHGVRGQLDLYLPDGASQRPLAMVIHGGGLQALSKERMEGVSTFVAEQGWVAVNVNYRLLPDHPFPASLQDVLRAYNWIQDTDHPSLVPQDRSRVILLGASAGGFLAMAAGLILGTPRVRAIVSISGPATRRRGKGEPDPALDQRLLCAPIELVAAGAPPFLAVHSRNDELVKPSESVAMVERLRKAGNHAELYLYDGPGVQHGIWRNDRPPLRFFEHIETAIAAFIQTAGQPQDGRRQSPRPFI